jgi:hypothetical protein
LQQLSNGVEVTQFPEGPKYITTIIENWKKRSGRANDPKARTFDIQLLQANPDTMKLNEAEIQQVTYSTSMRK